MVDGGVTSRRVPVAALALLASALFMEQVSAQEFLDGNHFRLSAGAEDSLDANSRPGLLTPDSETRLSAGEISAGLKEMLSLAVGTVITQLGSTDGFSADPAIHIPLPEPLGDIQSTLQRVGFGSQMEHLEMRLNMAAEAAVGQARDIFLDAVSSMTWHDASSIYHGPADAATRYFWAGTSESLAAKLRPVVKESLENVGAPLALARVVDQYHALPLSSEVDSDLTGYIVDRSLDGVFHYLAQEEAVIRRDPDKRSTETLQSLFGD